MSDATPAPDTELPVVQATPCRHLRSKGMYVYTDGRDEEPDEFDNSIYWCLETMKAFGPDDELVNRPDCRNPARSCYEPT